MILASWAFILPNFFLGAHDHEPVDLQAVLVFCRSGSTAIWNFIHSHPELVNGGNHTMTFAVSRAEANLRREMAVAAAKHPALYSQGENLFGIHSSPELSKRRLAYYLIMRHPVDRALSEYSYRRSFENFHPLKVKPHQTLSDYAMQNSNYYLRWLGNETTCPLHWSRCESFDAYLKSTSTSRDRSVPPCHLDYFVEEEYGEKSFRARAFPCLTPESPVAVFRCALNKTNALLADNLAFLQRHLTDLFRAVGLFERFEESMVLFAQSASWPVLCVPQKVNTRRSEHLMNRDQDARRLVASFNFLDLTLFGEVESLFLEQLQSTKADKRLLALAREGHIPECVRSSGTVVE